jgi:hypothetical protein
VLFIIKILPEMPSKFNTVLGIYKAMEVIVKGVWMLNSSDTEIKSMANLWTLIRTQHCSENPVML